MRRKLGQVASSSRRGRCLTTVLDVRCPDMDPGYRLPVNMVRLWLTAWQSEPRLHAGIARAWPTVVAKLTAMPAQMRSRHVRGPLSAL
eukprot:969031-Pyramimonas_sp.AAC.1